MRIGNAVVNTASSGDNTIVAAPGAGWRIRVTGYDLWADGTVNVKWWNGASANNKPLTGLIDMAVGQRDNLPQAPRDEGYSEGWFDCDENTALVLNLSAAVQVSGRVSYELMPV